jgi:hypothetical protein
MTRSIAWYSRLLRVPASATSHEGRIHSFPMQEGPGLISAGMIGLQKLLEPGAKKATEIQADLRAGRYNKEDDQYTRYLKAWISAYEADEKARRLAADLRGPTISEPS